ncbi:MAG: NAD(P)/FAD-dependent oxidoreductase, partial [Alphaproteobacteria bacterium]|nr:NAD(P)/FAD-dependent oxidoreductase [Alphaproteobacteria bacterium]
MELSRYDVIIIGAGAAGLSAAGVLARRNKRVVVFDMGAQPGRKVLASGGGRCNITNL